MKNFKLLLSLLVLFFALYSCNEQLEVQGLESLESKKTNNKDQSIVVSDDMDIDYCGTPVVCPLVAGQNIDAGTVTVRNDATYLYITVFSKAGFQNVDENVKIWAGTELPKKRPPAGHFPYKDKVTGLTSPEYKIKLSDIGWDGECGDNTQPLYIIVHADVLTESGSSETAFGGCIEADTKGAWWYYMEYTTQCCEEEDEGMRAFAYKIWNPSLSYCFNVDNENESYLAWTTEISYNTLAIWNYATLPIFLNPDRCDLENSDNPIEIGSVRVSLDSDDNQKFQVQFFINDNYKSLEYKVYAGVEKFPINNDGSLNNVTEDNFYGETFLIPTLLNPSSPIVIDWPAATTENSTIYIFAEIKI